MEQLAVEYDTSPELANAMAATAINNDDKFSLKIDRLEPNTIYYYRYSIENRVGKYTDKEVRQFKTNAYTGPVVRTLEATEVKAHVAILSGDIIATCGEAIREQGFCFGVDQNSLDSKVTSASLQAVEIGDLEGNTTYYYQAYAISDAGTGRGEVLSFTTQDGRPVLKTLQATQITSHTAVLHGEIVSDGGDPITERGFYLVNMDDADVEPSFISVDDEGDSFSKMVAGLAADTYYQYRVYAVNSSGIKYGYQISFTTLDIPITAFYLNPEYLNLTVGTSQTIVATILPKDATTREIVWSSSDETVATVDQAGNVTAISVGTTSIRAQAGTWDATCYVSVIIPVESVTLSKNSVTLEVGESVDVYAVISPDNATEPYIEWKSSDESVAYYDQYYGIIIAKKEGFAIITASAGDVSDECRVTVIARQVHVTDIYLNKSTLTLGTGFSEQLTATISPGNAVEKTVVWESYDEDIATVDQTGKVTGVAYGTTTVRATARDVWAECTVNVIVPVEKITLDTYSATLEEGDYIWLNATVWPADATERNVDWSSSDTQVINVYTDGRVSAVGVGTATVTASAGGKTAECVITVNKKIIHVTSIKLNKSELWLDQNVSQKLIATVEPWNATDRSVTWSSSNENVATVEQDGYVTARSGGTAIITASADGKTATCTVNVPILIESISLDPTSITLEVGQSARISATFSPADATRGITWESSDPGTVSVDQDGNVSALKAGTVTITAFSGDVRATATVIVKLAPPIKYLTFTSVGYSRISLENKTSPVLYYSKDKINWYQWDYSPLSFSFDSPVYLCGNNPSGFSNSAKINKFVVTGANFYCEGDIMSLIDSNEDIVIIPNEYCFDGLFFGCDKLLTAPSLTATELKRSCYQYMFDNCDNLTAAPDLPALILEEECYGNMFYGCYNLTQAPVIAAQTMAYRCCYKMFGACNKLQVPPSLPAMNLAEECYLSMFEYCYALTVSPALPATTLAKGCYREMFFHCEILTKAPDLPATVLAPWCYQQMFSSCINLDEAPARLPALTLAEGCYASMFLRSGIEKAPELPAPVLEESCYSGMFEQTSVNYVKCLAKDLSAARCTYGWLYAASSKGTFVKDAAVTWWPTGTSGIPEGWTVVDE